MSVTAPPSPLVGIGFGLSALILAVSLLLAGRVTIALEWARRPGRPQAALEDNPQSPLLSKLFRVTITASSKKKYPEGLHVMVGSSQSAPLWIVGGGIAGMAAAIRDVGIAGEYIHILERLGIAG